MKYIALVVIIRTNKKIHGKQNVKTKKQSASIERPA
jgi:hypothetical protein